MLENLELDVTLVIPRVMTIVSYTTIRMDFQQGTAELRVNTIPIHHTTGQATHIALPIHQALVAMFVSAVFPALVTGKDLFTTKIYLQHISIVLIVDIQ